ncbi:MULTISPECIES: molybdopterin-dependent oxidoreductase [unclassified Caballeronia]|uniref:molybdopterin-dependent oxidoreductase n=1 Tax=unclassified Caballeronia TaxID=2646786 RepID=UPI00286110C1|nr:MULTISPECIES: molybdopterin-dependent oxidoreductase [unclassified Caballeronia]MDR5773317.1 molybdopterin-dependent oxidoreductase [Caballeronia sp. LZ002]MDR5848751.1 molybdopterin-dependent oxidoreductase [Caballeronia sp. LZ003]
MSFAHDFKRLASLLLLLALLPFAVTACGGNDDSPPAPKATLSVSGEVATPGNLTLAQIQALPATTQTVSFGSGTGQQSHVYTGATVWSVLNQAGIVVNSAVHNDVLGKYVVATGSDNYRALFAMGELSPDFGNRGDLVAYAETLNGASAALNSTDGPLRVTAPGDVKGGRYVSNLVKLEVHSAMSTVTAGGGGLTTQFQLLGALNHPATFDTAALQALPPVTRTAGGNSYTGASLWDLINAAGIQTNTATKNDLLGFYVIATGSDGYRVVISLAELSSDFGNQPDIVAYAMNGAPLTSTGFARLVIPNDGKAGRYVSNLAALEVVSAPR